MSTIINKVFFTIVFGVVSWIGLRGLLVNYYSTTSKTYDILELEEGRIGSERFIEVTNGVAAGNLAFTDGIVGVNVLYPLISSKAMQKMEEDQAVIKVKVLVLRKYMDSGCIYSNSCTKPDGSAIVGVVSVGAKDGMGYLFEEDIEGSSIKLAPDVIVLEETDLIPWYWNLLMFICGTFLLLPQLFYPILI